MCARGKARHRSGLVLGCLQLLRQGGGSTERCATACQAATGLCAAVWDVTVTGVSSWVLVCCSQALLYEQWA